MAAYNAAMQFLAARDHSERELRKKLSRRFESETIDITINYLSEAGWLRAPEELSERVSNSLHRKNKGIQYINRFLAQKGLPAVDRDSEIELEKCRALLQKKFAKHDKLSYEEKKKAFRYLAYRGFDEDTIRKAVFEK